MSNDYPEIGLIWDIAELLRGDYKRSDYGAANIKFGNSFSNDGLIGQQFDYMLSNPPFGVEWKKVEQTIRDEFNGLGYAGRFGAGLPRISDGSLLFLQHMLSKRRGKIQLVNAASFFRKKEKSLGNKRKEIGDGEEGRPDQIAEIARIYGAFEPGPFCKILSW